MARGQPDAPFEEEAAERWISGTAHAWSLSLVSNLLTTVGRSREGATLIRAAEFEDVDEGGHLAEAFDRGRDEFNSQIMCLGAT